MKLRKGSRQNIRQTLTDREKQSSLSEGCGEIVNKQGFELDCAKHWEMCCR